MKTTGNAIALLVFTALILSGCAGLGTIGGKPAGGPLGAERAAPREGPQAPSWLTDREWTISGFNTGAQFVPLEPGHGGEAWLYFAADGTLAGYTGTNNFKGSWKLGQRNAKGAYPLVMAVGPMTRKAAINEIAARFETTFLGNLSKSVALVPGKSVFDLTGSAGDRLLSFIYIERPAGK